MTLDFRRTRDAMRMRCMQGIGEFSGIIDVIDSELPLGADESGCMGPDDAPPRSDSTGYHVLESGFLDIACRWVLGSVGTTEA